MVHALPLLKGMQHIKFENNSMQDDICAPVVISCFMNPDLRKISIINNSIKGVTANTIYELM